MFDTKGSRKEVFQDPKTGESVERHEIPDELHNSIKEAMEKHANISNQFVQNSFQYFQIGKICAELIEKRNNADVKIRNTLQHTCKKMKLKGDKWHYNIRNGCMELRVPPMVGDTEIRDNPNPPKEGADGQK